MSSADTPVPARRRLLSSIRSGRAFQVAAAALVALVVLVIIALLYGELPEFFHVGGQQLRDFVRHNAYLPGFGLLYIEESGVPLPAPGDVFVMYVATHVPHALWAWIAAWLGLIVAVVLGATNLFLISRRFGRRLVDSSLAEYVPLPLSAWRRRRNGSSATGCWRSSLAAISRASGFRSRSRAAFSMFATGCSRRA